MITTEKAGIASPINGARMNRSWTVEASRTSSYSVFEVTDIFHVESPALIYPSTFEDSRPIRRIVFIDSTVDALYGEDLRNYLGKHTTKFKVVPLPVSESNKNLDYVEFVLREIIDFGLSRREEPIVAIGGGVLLDIVGFAASTYRRGTPYIRVPTTLMGLIDAGIGIKTGVNYAQHKNRIGSYYPPRIVLLDKQFLKSLPRRHLLNGVAEIIKMAIVGDPLLFAQIEDHGSALIQDCFSSHPAADSVLGMSIQGMLEELHDNLWEENLERLVDFGHSFSPQIEMCALNELLHGEAVAVDMAICAEIAIRREIISVDDGERIVSLIERLGLPIYSPHCDFHLIEQSLLDCVRHRNGLQRIPLPTAIGKAAFFNDVMTEEVMDACRALKARCQTAAAA